MSHHPTQPKGKLPEGNPPKWAEHELKRDEWKYSHIKMDEKDRAYQMSISDKVVIGLSFVLLAGVAVAAFWELFK